VIRSLYRLRGAGNTVLVVEHDLDTMRASDRIINLGPGASHRGGRPVGAGPPQRLRRQRMASGRALDASCRGRDAPIFVATAAKRLSPDRWRDAIA